MNKPTKAEIRAGFNAWDTMYRNPDAPPNKTPRESARTDGANESESDTSYCAAESTTSDSAPAETFPAVPYDDELKLRGPIEDFRKAGRALLPLVVGHADAQDFGQHYFLLTSTGLSIFDSPDQFPVDLVRHVLTLVIEGGAHE